MLDILHVLLDSADIDHSLRAVVPLGSHRRARWVEAALAAIITTLVEGGPLIGVVWIDLRRLMSYQLGSF